MEPDFSGYATKAGVKCTDGRTITAEAFKHMDKMRVPLVWQHGHSSSDNILGHAILEARNDGLYCYGFFNNSKQGQNTKLYVEHGDLDSLSIYANQLVEKSKIVLHGNLIEVSLVLAGANKDAKIDYVRVSHGNGDFDTLEDEAVITMGLSLSHGEEEDEDDDDDDDELEHAEAQTIKDVYDGFSDIEKDVVAYMIGVALEGADSVEQSDNIENALAHKEGTGMPRNAFDQTTDTKGEKKNVLSHSDMRGIMDSAEKGGSFKTALAEYALAHGIEDIEILFPDARAVSNTPEFDKRRTEWVAGVINGTRHSPFSRIKTLAADLKHDEARAKGYIKGNMKKEEFFKVSKRITTPKTIYKKQGLDRDDIIDITDMDVVGWLWMEMRLMLDEEIARAVLIGDGRDPEDEDKISEEHIRPIVSDDDLYVATLNVNLDDASSSYTEFVDQVIETRRFYKGTGTPTMYTTELVIGKMLTLRDAQGRRMYRTLDDLAAELRVDRIVAVEPMEEQLPDVLAIIVNLSDYTLGTDKGGEISKFDDFDIDYNRYKYLLETRLSGCLTKIRSALVYRKVSGSAAKVVPVSPGFEDNVITPATTTGVTYKRADTNATVTTGAPITLTSGSLTIYAIPASSSYYFENNIEDEWTFVYQA